MILDIILTATAIALLAATVAWYWPAREEARRAGAVSDEYITQRQRARAARKDADA